MGQCQSCGEWSTLVEEQVESSTGVKQVKATKIFTVKNIEKNKRGRISTGFTEFDRVLGGDTKEVGIVEGSVVLISGDPGIGKSTLLLQTCANVYSKLQNILYISAEESVEQVALRAERIIRDTNAMDKINLVYSSSVEEIIATIEKFKSDFVIIDSIQTIETDSVKGFAGGLAQVKNSAIKLANFAKSNNVTMFIIGHITKEGNIAGPKLLEHLVDTVIQIEGEKNTDLRIVRGLKNRFGATNEVGILKMEVAGLSDVSNPSDYFLTKKSLPGICKSAILEGNRMLVVEVQSLVSTTVYPLPKRVAEGVSISRLQLICAIIQKYLRINLSDKDVYLNIAGGLKVSDRALDLAIAISIVSSIKNKAVDPDIVAMGEIALTGFIGRVTSEEHRKNEIKRLGFRFLTSSSKLNHVSGIISILA